MSKYALALGIISGVVYYWFTEYDSLELCGIHIYLILLIGVLLSSLMCLRRRTIKVSSIYSGILSGVFLAVSLRILYDLIFWDNSSHNLLPFEIIISLIISLAGITAGILIYKALQFVFQIFKK